MEYGKRRIASVKGAIEYEIKKDNKTVSTTEKTSWTEKNVQTNSYATYSVSAKKYTVSSEKTMIKEFVPKYYIPLSTSEINKNKEAYRERYVKLNDMKIDGYRVKDPSGNFSKSNTAIANARIYNNYDLYLLCKSGNNYVEIVLKDYKSWDWDNNKDDLLGKISKITKISVTGQMSNKFGDWPNHYSVPSVVIDHISWSWYSSEYRLFFRKEKMPDSYKCKNRKKTIMTLKNAIFLQSPV